MKPAIIYQKEDYTFGWFPEFENPKLNVIIETILGKIIYIGVL